MNIGIPKERRSFEYRVGLSPAGVQMLCRQGHTVYVEHDAGLGAGFTDQEYEQAGARIAYSPHEVFGRANLLLKVARPLLEEIEYMQPGSTVAGLLHMASARHDKIEALLRNKITAIAYEQITLDDGRRPVLRPLSEIGGRLAAQIAARLLQNDAGGKGILMGGMPGVPPAEVVILGAGTAGRSAAEAFRGMGAHVTVLDHDLYALQHMFECSREISTMFANGSNLRRAVAYADVLVGAVGAPGQRAPVIVTRELVRTMKNRSLIMDLSIDQGGCVETSRPTTHERPTFIEEGMVHYCVPNIPAVIARTATYVFVNAASSYIQEIANQGVTEAVSNNPALWRGVTTFNGELHIARMDPKGDSE